jgi:hypothetical protein
MTHVDASHRDGAERGLLAILFFTGLSAIVGGVLLIVRPDGSLLQASESALASTPFTDWRIPGVLLTILVGLGGVGTAGWILIQRPGSRALVYIYATGLLIFEIIEWARLGFQPLEGMFGLIAVGIFYLGSASGTIGPGKAPVVRRPLPRHLWTD